MKRPVRLVMYYLLILLGVGLCVAIWVPEMQLLMLVVFGSLFALAMLVFGGMFTLGVQRFLFDTVPTFVKRRIHLWRVEPRRHLRLQTDTSRQTQGSNRSMKLLTRTATIFGWVSILSLAVLAILLFIRLPEIRPLLLLVTLGLAGLAAVVFFLYEAPRMDRYLLWIERLMYRVTPLSNLYLELGRQAQFHTPRQVFARWAITEPGVENIAWRRAVVAVLPGYAAIYPLTVLMNEVFTFRPDQVRWLGRPRRLSDTEGELWLDVEVDSRWHTLQIRLARPLMKHLYDALREFLPTEQGAVRNLQRPNLRQKPVEAKTTAKGEAVQLFLTPLHLVILQDGDVRQAVALDDIAQVSASDSAQAVEFTAQGRQYAFTLEGYQGFVDALAKATRFTPQEPGSIEGGESIALGEEDDEPDYVVGDDGEIQKKK